MPQGAGKYRHRVIIKNPNETRDSFGQPIESASTVATVWAAVRPLRSREKEAAQQVLGEATHEVRVRHRTDVTADYYVLFGSRRLDIAGPPIDSRDERGFELVMICKERP
jgi:SPP1 family predicted phage head-tail adaptor